MTAAAGCALAAALASGSALAAPVTLDFEDFANGDIVNGSQGVGISGVNGSAASNPVVAFFTDPGLNGDDPDLQAPFDPIPGDLLLGSDVGLTQGEQGQGAGGDNPVILIIQEDPNQCGATSCPSPDDERDGGAITFDFTSFGGVTLLSIDLFDIDDSFPKPESVTITSFDGGMNELGTIIISGVLIGENAAGRLNFLNGGNTGVSFLEVAFASSGAVGNVTFQTRIPDPAPLAVLAVGLAGLGIARGRARRRQR